MRAATEEKKCLQESGVVSLGRLLKRHELRLIDCSFCEHPLSAAANNWWRCSIGAVVFLMGCGVVFCMVSCGVVVCMVSCGVVVCLVVCGVAEEILGCSCLVMRGVW